MVIACAGQIASHSLQAMQRSSPFGIAAQRVLAAEARRQRALLERIIERRLRLEEIAHRQHEGLREFLQKQRAGGLIKLHRKYLVRRLAKQRRTRTADGLADPIAQRGKDGDV